MKISVNKMSSDLAENLHAVSTPGGLTAHKISAKSDDILLTENFELPIFVTRWSYCDVDKN